MSARHTRRNARTERTPDSRRKGLPLTSPLKPDMPAGGSGGQLPAEGRGWSRHLRVGTFAQFGSSDSEARVTNVQIELGYDRAGSRLSQIGAVQIDYDRAGSRPRAVGQVDLDYDMAGNRLRAVAGAQIAYDKLGSRPVRFGDLALEYDRLGSRLVRIGNMSIDYDRAGSRVRRIGGFTVDYDRMGSRPRFLRADDHTQLDDQALLIVFLVLVAFKPDD